MMLCLCDAPCSGGGFMAYDRPEGNMGHYSSRPEEFDNIQDKILVMRRP